MKAVIVMLVIGIAYGIDRRNWRKEARRGVIALRLLWGLAGLYAVLAVTPYRSLLPNPLTGITALFRPLSNEISRWVG